MKPNSPELPRRRFLQPSVLAAGGLVNVSAPAHPAFARAPQRAERRASPSPPLSRQFAAWVAKLRYEDLPPAVIDRAKGVTLQNVASALLGSQMPAGQQAVQFVTDEESGVARGATILVGGTKVTRGGAAFANSEMMLAAGKWDTFRMAHASGHGDHPGCTDRG